MSTPSFIDHHLARLEERGLEPEPDHRITTFPSNPSPFAHLPRLIIFVRFGSWDPVVDRSMGMIIPNLLRRFSSEEGYMLFDVAVPTSTYLHTYLCLSSTNLALTNLHYWFPPTPYDLKYFLIFCLISSSLLQRLFFIWSSTDPLNCLQLID